ncbi:hypothetical protein HanPSC8_Chr17g0779591 [Helianthus annuus]|nr:hypothetical protein HanIR_Chr17g0881471 [Helianthus annuus]KAJ0813947.1 hypothetical protein HanPSC8_Chr17g0779591 [Helianthus annuus]
MLKPITYYLCRVHFTVFPFFLFKIITIKFLTLNVKHSVKHYPNILYLEMHGWKLLLSNQKDQIFLLSKPNKHIILLLFLSAISHQNTKKRRSINNIVREMKTGENGHHLGQCFTAARQPPATTPAARKAINRRLRCVVSDQIPVYRAPVGCKRHSGGDTGVNGCYDELPASPGDAFHLRQAPVSVFFLFLFFLSLSLCFGSPRGLYTVLTFILDLGIECDYDGGGGQWRHRPPEPRQRQL